VYTTCILRLATPISITLEVVGYTVYTAVMQSPASWLGRAVLAPMGIAGRTGSRSYWSRLAAMMALGEWIYRDAHYFVADVELDARDARRFVPWPLRLAKPARGQVFTAYFPTTTFGSVYREAGVFFDVLDWRRRRAIYSPWMLVDDDVALIAGRELLGYPKKLGEFTWQLAGDHIRTTARRRGHELLAMEATLGERIASPPPMLGRPHRNIRATTGVMLPKVIAFQPRERAVEVRSADLTMAILGSPRDPLHEMGLGRVLAARLHRVDLGGGALPLPVGIVSPLGFMRQLLARSH
jgi:acetoacetate decarboxylase